MISLFVHYVMTKGWLTAKAQLGSIRGGHGLFKLLSQVLSGENEKL